MRHRRTVAVVLGLVLLLYATPPASADSAAEQLKHGVERVFDALGNPSVAGSLDERRQLIHQVDEHLFDWTEMGQRLLGATWGERTPAEHARFIALLADIVDAHVLALAPSGVERILWNGQTVTDDRATIRTTVVMNRGHETSLDYRMILRDGVWRVYDVVMDNVSFLGTYRAQFRQIMKSASYEGLIDRLEH